MRALEVLEIMEMRSLLGDNTVTGAPLRDLNMLAANKATAKAISAGPNPSVPAMRAARKRNPVTTMTASRS